MAFDSKPVKLSGVEECFLKEASETLGWGNLSEDVVMDIGSNYGRSSYIFLELFPNVQKVIVIDICKKKVEEAQANNPHEKLEYEVADIQERSTLTQWEGKISKAISTYCFSELRRMKEAFENLRQLLQPAGEAALLINLHGPFDEVMDALYLCEEWTPYLALFINVFPPELNRSMRKEDYLSIAESAGFEVVECKELEINFKFPSEEEFKNIILQWIPIVEKMNQDLEVKFKDYLLGLTLKFNPKTEDGEVCIRNNGLSLLLRRPT